MGDVLSLEQALADSEVVNDLADDAGVAPQQVRKLLASLSNVPIRQAVRIAKACHDAEIVASNRRVRLGR